MQENFSKVKGDTYYGRVAKVYQRRREKQPLWAAEQDLIEKIFKDIPNNQKVVDIPFGTGRFVPFYVEHEHEITGLDASKEMLQQASVELGQDIEKCELMAGFSTQLPFADKQFDILVSARFLRDIITFKDVKTTLDEFARVTNSRAIIQLGEKINGKSDDVKDDERMSSRLNAEGNKALLEAHGFKIREKHEASRDEGENSAIYFFDCDVVV